MWMVMERILPTNIEKDDTQMHTASAWKLIETVYVQDIALGGYQILS